MSRLLRTLRGLVPAVMLAGLGACASGGNGTSVAFNRLPGLGADTVPASQAAFTARAEAGAPVMIATVLSTKATSGLVQISSRGSDTMWATPDGVSVALNGGVLTGTRGMGNDLMTADVAETRDLILTGRPGQGVRINRYLNGSDGIEIDSFVCDVSSRGGRDVTLGRAQFKTELMQETCTNPDRRFQNLYWVQNGRILQSRQWISPKLGALEMRTAVR